LKKSGKNNSSGVSQKKHNTKASRSQDANASPNDKNQGRSMGTRQSVPHPGGAVRPAAMPAGDAFGACLAAASRELAPGHELDVRSLEALAEMDYPTECKVKQRAMEIFKHKHGLKGELHKLTPSPRPRGYRTTSKRRARFSQGKLELFIEHRQQSKLEPDIHADIFAMIQNILSASHYQVLSRHLNYCIIRGSYEKCAVIMNVDHVDGSVVRKLKQLAVAFQERERRIVSCFMYLDETKSDYYLESRRPEQVLAFKKLFGSDFLDISVDNMRLLYPPTVFSQVNESILPEFTAAIRELLDLKTDMRLLDLYCGYGLLGLTASQHVNSVIGMDIEGPAVKAAIGNAAHQCKGKNIKFIAAAITAGSLREKLPPPVAGEVILLDPPRQGTSPGVIEELARRQPARVLHIFCGTDEIPRELKLWEEVDYVSTHIVPLDMFPGSMNLETLVLLEPRNE
jgi:tRNA/tmRNA/rRNA uracil-C5-methylase (TrmA/RlmC/RlmD family)